MVHVTDMFTTLAELCRLRAADGPPIDGKDQCRSSSAADNSDREDCIVWLNEELHAVKWKDFKINFKRQQHFHDPELRLGFARITHLKDDPKEREAVNQRYVRWWVMQHAHRIVGFRGQHQEEPTDSVGSALDFVPKTSPAFRCRHRRPIGRCAANGRR